MIIRAYVASIISLTIVHLQHWNIWVAGTPPVCDSPQCKMLADMYIKNLNKHANPCHDFYDFVCHNWGNQHPKPRFATLWKIEEALQEKAYAVMKNILEFPKMSPKRDTEQARALYKACMNLPHVQQADFNVVKNVIAQVGPWPMFQPKNAHLPENLAWWQIDNAYIQRTGESALFDIYLATDPARKNIITTTVTTLDSPYGMVKLQTGWSIYTSGKEYYKSFLKELIKRVAPHNPGPFKATIETDINDVLNFRNALREMIGQVHSHSMGRMPIKDVQHWYNTATNSRENGRINWLEVIRHVYKDRKDAYGVPIQESTVIHIQQTYFRKLAELLEKVPKRVIVNHIHLFFAERNVHHTPGMIADLKKSCMAESTHPIGFVTYPLPRSRTCIESSSMPDVMNEMYIVEHFPKRKHDEVENLFGIAKRLFKRELVECPWLNNQTRKDSISKLEYISSSIGYPKKFEDPAHTAKDEFDVRPLAPDLYYVPIKNQVYVSAAFLEAPVFVPNVPYVVNYGSMVAAFSHELQHAFDERGLHFPRQMHNEYARRAGCFKAQYTSQRLKVLKKYNLNFTPDLPITFGEDIADVVGVKTAFRGYKDAVAKSQHECPVLPGFEKMGCDRLFFIAFANTFCAEASAEGEQALLLKDVHSLPRIRVNTAVSNMEEFSTAFKCKPNDPLNLDHRCELWRE